MTRDVVLVLTHEADHFGVDRVIDSVRRRGRRALRFDTDRFPREAALEAWISPDGSRHVVRDRGAAVDSREVCAVWARHVFPPRLADDLDPEFRDACANESIWALRGFLDGLHDARWIDPPARQREAEEKLRQLRLAREAGLRVPPTLVTNDPGAARAFFEERKGAVVAKLLRPLETSMGRPSRFVYTSPVAASDLDDAESLRHCPMVFQERLEKAHELRVAIVGEKLFAARIDASGSAGGRIDWRLASPDECRFAAADLPDRIARSLAALMRSLGLAFGAADLVVTPEGEHVFLEVNPCGEWGMLERDAGLPISGAIADALLEPPRGGGR
jgi:glutathione synthase/RimK-type ligase-like ATP-grasp enzyme